MQNRLGPTVPNIERQHSPLAWIRIEYNLVQIFMSNIALIGVGVVIEGSSGHNNPPNVGCTNLQASILDYIRISVPVGR